MLENLSIISFTIFIAVFVFLVVKLITQSNQNKNIKIDMVRLAQELAILKNLLDQKEKLVSDKNDGFVKFISDSREWAFEYIENVQSTLDKFISEVEPIIDYFDEYGDSMSMQPNYNSMEKISIAFKELKTLLPEEKE